MSDVADDIAAALKGMEGEPESTPTEAPAPEPQDEQVGQPRDERGRFAPGENASEQPAEPAEATEQEQSEEPTIQAVEPPQHWSREDKDLFRKAPPEYQNWLLTRHKSMEGDYTRKSQELAEQRKQVDAIQQVFAPYQKDMQELGLDPAGAVKKLLDLNNYARQDPRGYIQWVAGQFNIDLNQIAKPAQGEAPKQTDSHVDALNRKIAALENQLGQVSGTIQHQQVASAEQQISAFANQTDDQGNLAHPYFERVKPMMGNLLASSQAPDLQTAYDMAIWADPTIRAEMQTAQQTAAEQQRLQVERERAQKATHAAASIPGTGSPPPAPQELPNDVRGLTEHLARQMGLYQ